MTASRSHTVHVLIGTYELLAFRNLSAQLSRRSVDLHFSRYRTESAEDIEVFQNAVFTFQKQLRSCGAVDLPNIWDFLYERSLGCIGILKDWLMQALVVAARSATPALSLAVLEKTALSGSQCEKMLQDAREGETRLADNDDTRVRLRRLLNLPDRAVAPAAAVKALTPDGPRVGRRRQASAARGAIRLACRVKPERCRWRMPDPVVYRSWEQASPRAIPPRSYLYHVTPMGLGSAGGESLTSYLARLAAAHDISPGVLLTREILPKVREEFRRHDYQAIHDVESTFLYDAHTLNGVGQRSQDWIDVLEQLTGVRGLKYLTMGTWRRSFPGLVCCDSTRMVPALFR